MLLFFLLLLTFVLPLLVFLFPFLLIFRSFIYEVFLLGRGELIVRLVKPVVLVNQAIWVGVVLALFRGLALHRHFRLFDHQCLLVLVELFGCFLSAKTLALVFLPLLTLFLDPLLFQLLLAFLLLLELLVLSVLIVDQEVFAVA